MHNNINVINNNDSYQTISNQQPQRLNCLILLTSLHLAISIDTISVNFTFKSKINFIYVNLVSKPAENCKKIHSSYKYAEKSFSTLQLIINALLILLCK